MKISPYAVSLMIEANERRHNLMRSEVEAVISKSRDYLAGMFAHDCGLQLDEVVNYSGELAIVDGFELSSDTPEGFKVKLISYLDDEKVALVPLSNISK